MSTALRTCLALLLALAVNAPAAAAHSHESSRAKLEKNGTTADRESIQREEPLSIDPAGAGEVAEAEPLDPATLPPQSEALGSTGAQTPAREAVHSPTAVANAEILADPSPRQTRWSRARAAIRPIVRAALGEFDLKKPETVAEGTPEPPESALETFAARLVRGHAHHDHHDHSDHDEAHEPHAHEPSAPPSPELVHAAKRSLKIQTFAALVELAGGLYIGSFAIVADSIHLAVDLSMPAMPLISSWLERVLAGRIKGYDHAKTEAIIALSGLGAIALTSLEAIHRLFEPVAVPGLAAMGLAFVGLISNFIASRILLPFQDKSLPAKAAFQHFVADTAGSLVIMATGGLMAWTGWLWLDPASNFLVVVIAIALNWSLIRVSWRTLRGRSST